MNTQIVLFPSVARTTSGSVPSADIDNTENYTSALIVIDVTAVTSTPSVVFTVQGKDLLSGKYYPILVSAAITGTGTTVLHVGDGTADVDDFARGTRLPRVWRIEAVHGDVDSITYSIGADLSSGPVHA